MGRILLAVFAVAMCFTLGYTLECYKCKLGIYNLCFTTKEMCAAGYHCFSGIGKAAGMVDLKSKGCLEIAKCNQTTDVAFPFLSNTTLFKMTQTCCDSDLCNAATPLATTHTLTIAITSLATLLLTKVLV